MRRTTPITSAPRNGASWRRALPILVILLLLLVDGSSFNATRSLADRSAAAAQTPADRSDPAAPEGASDRWQAQIAFGYSGDSDEPEPAFLAENTSWLMFKYGQEDMVAAVRDAGFDGPVLQYQTAFQILGPGPYTSKDDRCRNDYTPVKNNPMWTDDYCEKVHERESWFLHNGKGERLYTRDTNWDGSPIYNYYMDPGSDGFRAFWVAQAKRQSKGDWDGFFLDNVAVDYDYLRTRADNQDGQVAEFQSNRDWQRAMAGLIGEIKKELPDATLWGNMIEGSTDADAWDAYVDVLDGFQDESFATGWVGREQPLPRHWQAMLERAERMLANGRQVVLQSQGLQDDMDRMRFATASYLLVATTDARATFRYTYTRNYSELWWYPEYDLNLGAPLGSRYQRGEEWVRDFACGQVTVNPAAFTGTIQVGPCQTK